ncbi:hypothetical protein HGRIS_013281 [Hohenbuehelia grisea]|uniref:Transcriptional regulatory protein n=1 Tax=Hohenbuehelia grisea TaxID=104357 RepID=A0ABR3IV67_9AGAR
MSTFRSATAFVHQIRRSIFATPAVQAGHNKWSKIKQKKGILDAQKSAIYGKARRDIVVAIRSGGSDDPAKNITLAGVLQRAKAQGVPKENIESALLKGSGKEKGGGQHLVYEALAYNSVGIIIECLTDNTNRTLHNVRSILTTHDARFAPVKFMFRREGNVRLALTNASEERLEKIIEKALGAGATDFEDTEVGEGEARHLKFSCEVADLFPVTNAVAAPDEGVEITGSELIYTPVEAGAEVDEETRAKLSDLTQELEDDDDTIRVWTTHAT